MNHWLLDAIQGKRAEALRAVARADFRHDLADDGVAIDEDFLRKTAAALEMATLDLWLGRSHENPVLPDLLRDAAADAFRLLQSLPLPKVAMEAGTQLLRASALAVLADQGAEAARWLRELEAECAWPRLPLDSPDWGARCHATLIDVWLRILGQKDRNGHQCVLEQVAALRASQGRFERDYLQSLDPLDAKRSALELIAIYHLTRAAEILAKFIFEGEVGGNQPARQLLDSHFDQAIAACQDAPLLGIGPNARLLAAAASRMLLRAPVAECIG